MQYASIRCFLSRFTVGRPGLQSEVSQFGIVLTAVIYSSPESDSPLAFGGLNDDALEASHPEALESAEH